MNNNIKKGKLKRWDDSKGFGFISSPSGEKDIFLHISALKRVGHRPIVGDIITYQIHTDNNGKKRAVNASLDRVPVNASRASVRSFKQEKKEGTTSKVVSVCFIALLGLSAYTFVTGKNMTDEDFSSPVQSVLPAAMKTKTENHFSCNGKVYCSEMRSCAEAKFYQRNCPGTKMDGDGDGMPCESQWCKW